LKGGEENTPSVSPIKRRNRRYLEANPMQFAKAPRTLDSTYEIPFEEITIDPDPIGNGGYGTVFKGRWRGTEIAIKKMHIESTVPSDRYSDFINECQAMASVRHPNIVLFIGACTKPPNLCIVLEY
jgi:hypothetical protein